MTLKGCLISLLSCCAVCQCNLAMTEVHIIMCTRTHPGGSFCKSTLTCIPLFTRFVLVVSLPQGIFHFQLGRGEPMLHTRLRPHCKEFLEKIAKLYELHVFTFGSRLYAHTIAGNRLDYLRLLIFSVGAFVPSAHVHKRVVSAEDCLSWGGCKSLSESLCQQQGPFLIYLL